MDKGFAISRSLDPIFFSQGELPQEVTLCSSDTSHIWISILLVYKEVELVFSQIFAFETRKVKVKELNDSKIIVFVCTPLWFQPLPSYPQPCFRTSQMSTMQSLELPTYLLAATVLLAIIYVPKVTSSTDAILTIHIAVVLYMKYMKCYHKQTNVCMP